MITNAIGCPILVVEMLNVSTLLEVSNAFVQMGINSESLEGIVQVKYKTLN